MRSDTNGGVRIITEAPKDATAFLSVAELLARYRRKDLSPVEMVRAVLDQIDRHNSIVNAYCWVDRDAALRGASDSEARWMAGAPRGLIDGVPVGVKDNVLVAGMPARFGSKLTSDALVSHDPPSAVSRDRWPMRRSLSPSSLLRTYAMSMPGRHLRPISASVSTTACEACGSHTHRALDTPRASTRKSRRR